MVKKYGLIGKNISYSYSEKYFKSFFKKNNLINCNYQIYDLKNLNEIKSFLFNNDLKGINITIPYKEEILNYVDILSPEVEEIKAANTLSIKDRKIIAHNTDVFGFEKSYKSYLERSINGLILGTGGASKAVAWVLKKYNINISFASREKKGENIIHYPLLLENGLSKYCIIINCSPIGTFPDLDKYPNIPYETLKKKCFLIDLIYNPDKTKFMQLGEKNGAIVKNGLEMLHFQADKSWEIWNK